MNKKIVRFSSLLIAVLMVLSLCACGEEEETYDYKSPLPTTTEDILTRFNEAVAGTKKGNPGISYSIKQGAGMSGEQKDKCENEYIKAAFKTVSKAITKESFSNETAYGDSTKDIFPTVGSEETPVLTNADVRSAYCMDNKDDGTGATYVIVIKIYPEKNPNQTDSVYGKLYNIMDDEEILSNFDVVSNIVKVESYSAQYGEGTIKAILKKDTDQLTELQLSRDVVVTTELVGQGTLAEDIGTVPLEFNYNSTEKYSIDWFDPATRNAK